MRTTIKQTSRSYAIEFRSQVGGTSVTLDAELDSGTPYAWIPSDVLDAIGAEPGRSQTFVTQDGVKHSYRVSQVRMRLAERDGFAICVRNEPGTRTRLGWHTLAGFGLTAGPRGGLIPIKVFPVPSFWPAES